MNSQEIKKQIDAKNGRINDSLMTKVEKLKAQQAVALAEESQNKTEKGGEL